MNINFLLVCKSLALPVLKEVVQRVACECGPDRSLQKLRFSTGIIEVNKAALNPTFERFFLFVYWEKNGQLKPE